MGPIEFVRLLLASKGLADPSLIVAPCAQIPLRMGINVTTPAVIKTAHEVGIQVHVWTINTIDEMHQLVDMDADGIMTDCTAELRDVLIERHAWAPAGAHRTQPEESAA